jgi:hypothetical protein
MSPQAGLGDLSGFGVLQLVISQLLEAVQG